MRVLSYFASALLLAFVLPLSAAELVKGGKAQMVILLSANPTSVEKYAAEELAHFVQKSTSGLLPIVKAPVKGKKSITFQKHDAKATGKIVSRIKMDGFAIEANQNGVKIHAKHVRGFLYGVYHILRKYASIYFLYPGEEGEVIPKMTSLVIPDSIEVRNPVFYTRKFYLNGGSGWTPPVYQWLLRNGLINYHGNYNYAKGNGVYAQTLAKLGTVFERGGHAMGSLLVGGSPRTNKEAQILREKLMKKHPEYFGLVNGKRLYAGNPRPGGPRFCQPCTSNEAALKRMLDNCIKECLRFGTTENARNFMNDDHYTWCECASCLKLDHPQQTTTWDLRSKRWWHFVNYMAKGILDSGKCPHTTHVTTLAYQNYRLPPKGIKPDPRVHVGIAPHQRCYIHSLTDPTCFVNAGKYRGLFESWHKAGMRLYTFEYHPETPGITNYLFNEEAWVRDLQFYHSINMAGFGMVTNAPNAPYRHYAKKYPERQYACQNRWMSSWQRHFLTGYYSWNIDADYNKISEKINTLYYGKTWKVMKEYRALLTAAVQDSRLHMGYGTPSQVLGKCYDRPGLPRKAAELLEKAALLAKGDPLLEKRIAWDKEYFEKNWAAAYKEYSSTIQKEYNVKKRTGKIVIDGNLNELDWKESNFVSDFKLFNAGSLAAPKADPATYVRMLFDKDALYFAVEALKAPHGKVNKSSKKDGLGALDGSHLEFFITHPDLKGRYYHIGISITGKLYQALTETGSTRDENVKVDPQYKVKELADRWILEARVPLAPLKLQVKEGEVWRINVGRGAVGINGKMQHSSWSNGVFHGSDVHRSVAFGEQGAILRNGDLEDQTNRIRKVKRRNRKPWTYLSPTIPNFWFFNENNTGTAKVHSNKPWSGKYCMNVKGQYAFIGSNLVLPEKRPERVRLSVMLRGKGEFLMALYSGGKY